MSGKSGKSGGARAGAGRKPETITLRKGETYYVEFEDDNGQLCARTVQIEEIDGGTITFIELQGRAFGIRRAVDIPLAQVLVGDPSAADPTGGKL